jgi:xanthine dehydrogenase YagS FAD-binding subunit
VAAVIDHSGGRIDTARLAFGGLAHKPWRVEKAERILVAGGIDAWPQAADAVLEGAKTYGGNDFKPALLRRTLHAVLTETMKA